MESDDDAELPLELAASRLNLPVDGSSHEPTIRFHATVIAFDRRAIILRDEISRISIRRTGYRNWESLEELEAELVTLHKELIEARLAIENGTPSEFSHVQHGWSSDAQNTFFDSENRVMGQINSTFEELEATRAALTAKQEAATTRIGLCISVSAVLLSVISVIVVALGNF